MAWFTRFTRFGDMHFVFGQEEGMTCGPSAALMCYTKLKKLAPSAPLYADTHPFQKLYEKWLGTSYDGIKDGTWPEGLVYILNSQGCGNWRKDLYAPNDAVQAIEYFVGTREGLGPTIDVSPVIVGVNWDGSTASHWVCIDTVRSFLGSTYATICDPWDADVHVQSMTRGKPFVYTAAEQFHVDFWGSHFKYEQPSTGRVREWPIIHLTS
jgi:hypothetical protein